MEEEFSKQQEFQFVFVGLEVFLDFRIWSQVLVIVFFEVEVSVFQVDWQQQWKVEFQVLGCGEI